MYRNDDYGKDYKQCFLDCLCDKAGKIVVLEQSYEVTDPTVDSQIVNLKASGADVFFNITTPKFAAQAIRKAHDIGWKPVHFLNEVSNSIKAVLEPAGFEASKGLITTFYLKDPDEPQWKDDKGRKDWLEWMKKYYPEGNIHDRFYVYAYTASQTLAHVLKQAGDNLTRENIIKQAASIKDLELPMLIPGIKVNTSSTDFRPIEQEQLAKFDGQTWLLFGQVIDGAVR